MKRLGAGKGEGLSIPLERKLIQRTPCQKKKDKVVKSIHLAMIEQAHCLKLKG
jgi:hypothetical protein